MTDPGIGGKLAGEASPTDTFESLADEYLQSTEVAPKPTKAGPEPTPPCDKCDKTFIAGHMGVMHRAAHMKAKHSGPAVTKKASLPKSAAAVKAAGPEPKAKARKPAGENLSLLVSAGAQFAAKTGRLPLANALAFEAPAAGAAIDTAIAGTWPDKHIIQPLNSGAEKWEALGAVLTLPVMVHLISVYPGLQDAFEPQLRRAAEEILVLSIPTIRKKVDKDRKVAEALVELGHLDPTIAASKDPVGDILAGFFAGSQPAPEPDGD